MTGRKPRKEGETVSYEDETPQPEPQPAPEPEPAPAPPAPEPVQPQGEDVVVQEGEVALPPADKVRVVRPEPYTPEPENEKDREPRVELA